MKLFFACVAWLIAAAIVLSTLLPIDFRPHLQQLDPDIERFCAFFALTIAFMIAYPARRIAIVVAMAVLAIALELGQLAVPGRHGMAHDAIVKLLGVGLASAALSLATLRRREEPSR